MPKKDDEAPAVDDTPDEAPSAADARTSGRDHLVVPLVVMLVIAGAVGGMAYWKLAFHEPVATVEQVAATEQAATTTEAPPADTSAVVVVKDGAFTPSAVTIKVGETVTWQIDDAGKLHGVAGLSDFGMIINSDYLRSGNYTVTFDRPGEYRYIDSLDPTVTGTVTVE